jgi:hypothetical protein
MLWHDNFFTDRKGQTRTCWKIANLDNGFIIQYPHIDFGSCTFPWVWLESNKKLKPEEKTPVYFQEFELHNFDKIFDSAEFMSKVEKHAFLEPDETLWFETGFWSIVMNGSNYMGIGVEQLTSVLKEHEDAKFALCLSNRTSMLLIKSGDTPQKTNICVYCSNEILPFVEVVEPFRKAVAEYNDNRVLTSSMLWEENLLRFWFASHELYINPVAYIMGGREDPTYKQYPIIRNEFQKTRDNLIKKLDFITGTYNGGFIESDYDGGLLFDLCAEIWNLGNVTVIEFLFDDSEVT